MPPVSRNGVIRPLRQIFIPFAVEVKGSIIRVFDEYNHREVAPGSDMRLQGKYDRRYRLIERPVIIVGG